MLRMRPLPRIEQLFRTELPSMHIPNGVSPASLCCTQREVLSVLMLRFMTSRLRAMYQAYDGDLTLCLVLGEIASRNTERFYDERRGLQPRSPNAPEPQLLCLQCLVHF